MNYVLDGTFDAIMVYVGALARCGLGMIHLGQSGYERRTFGLVHS